MLKYEHIEPGQKIRAYDFEPYGDWRDDMYIEGVVVSHDHHHEAKVLVVECKKDCGPKAHEQFGPNRPSRVGNTIFVPMEIAFLEWDGRVIDLMEAE